MVTKRNQAQRKKRQKKGKKKPAEPPADEEPAQSRSELLQGYLEQWAQRSEDGAAWKFSKKLQTVLLKSWPDRKKVSGPVFQLSLAYMAGLQGASRDATIAQARAAAEAPEPEPAEPEGEGEEDDEEAAAERAASLQIRRARGLKVLKALLPEV